MTDALELWRKPEAQEIFMLAGWRQWADAGSVSSGLPLYLIQQTGAEPIGSIRPDGFYLFQVPGTHDLMRPVVKFNEGYPELLLSQRNELYYSGNSRQGLVIFLGDEPHMDIERYTDSFLNAASILGVKRMIGFGGVYGELPYNKERMVSGMYSLPEMKEEMNRLAVTLSDYHGGASIESYLCRRAADRNLSFAALYAFVPSYDFSDVEQIGNTIRIENDFTAWLGIMRRLKYLLKLDFDLTDLEEKSRSLQELVESKIDEMDTLAPQLNVRDYMARLEENFTEVTFNPLDDVWEDELRRLLGKFDDDDEPGSEASPGPAPLDD